MRAGPGLFIAIRTVSTLNSREHWRSKSNRVKRERTAAAKHLLAGRSSGAIPETFGMGLTVRFTRYSAGLLDRDDNLNAAFKGIRDEIAAFYDVDDRETAWQWQYDQERVRRGCFGIRVEIDRTDAPPAAVAAAPTAPAPLAAQGRLFHHDGGMQ